MSHLQLIAQERLSDYVKAIAWSPSRPLLAACTSAGEVALWDSHKLTLLQPGDGLSMDCLGFSPDGQFLAAGGQNGRVKIWQLQPMENRLVASWEWGSAWIDQLAWSPVDNVLAIAVGRQVRRWSADIKLSKLNFESSSVLGLAWHPQGQLLAVSGHKSVKVWNLLNDKIDGSLEVPGASLCPAWTGDGKYLASGNLDRTLSVMEWGNPPPWLMQGFPGKVSHIAWSELTSSGAPLLAAACSGGIAVWQRDATGDNWHSTILEAHQGYIKAIAWSPQSLLASAGDDGCFWHQGQVAQSLTGVAGSCLTWNGALAAGGQQGELLIWEASD